MKIKRITAVLFVLFLAFSFSLTVFASESTTTTASAAASGTSAESTTATTTRTTVATTVVTRTTTKTTAPSGASTTGTTTTGSTKTTKTTTTTTLVVASSPESSLGSITFKTSNSKRVEVGKSTMLYITLKDMPGSTQTAFDCSDPSIASIERISNTCVKVVGLKQGEVVISATAEGKTAKYSLLVGGADMTAAAVGDTDTDTTTAPEAQYVDIDLFDGYETELSQFIEEKNRSSATSVIVGIIFWAAILTAAGVILSIIFKGRVPGGKVNLNPGSRRRFNTGGYRGNYRKRLLPDHYYRSIRKY